MGKDYYLFECEKGDTAFLAGVVDVLSGNLGRYVKFGSAIDADIFYVKDNDISLLSDTVKKRLHTYNDKEGLNIPYEKIQNIDFHLKEVKADVRNVLYGSLESHYSKEMLSDKVTEFLESLE